MGPDRSIITAHGGTGSTERWSSPGRRSRPRMSLNLTPMIDVVFQLLIYFLVCTNFARGEQIYKLDLPQRGTAPTQADPFQLDDEPLRIQVLSLGNQPGDYRLRLEGPWPRVADFQQLYEFLQQRIIGRDNPTGLFAPDHPIVIEPAGSTSWGHAVGAFNASVRAGYNNITFAETN